ncbi:MAG: universal stress protein [Calditrichia bacterium]
MEIKKILVPVDFSEFSDKALEYAIEFAKQFDASLTLFHAIIIFQEDVDEEQRLEAYQEWVKNHEDRITRRIVGHRQKAHGHGIQVDTVVQRGISPADVILEYIEENNFDLIVMGTHGRSGLKHLFLGSVAEKVSRISKIPVLTVHRSVKEFQMQNLLVAVDFSPYSKEATDYAVALAKKFHSRIKFIHVIEKEIHPSFYASGISSIFEIDTDLEQRVIENMKTFLEDQLQPEGQYDYIVKEGRPHKEIVEFSQEDHTDMIIIASHGLTGLDYILLGSTAEKVVRWANSPVLIVKKRT